MKLLDPFIFNAGFIQGSDVRSIFRDLWWFRIRHDLLILFVVFLFLFILGDTFFVLLELFLLVFIVQNLLLRIFSICLWRFSMMLFLVLTSYLWVWAFLPCCRSDFIVNFLVSDFLGLISFWNWWAYSVINLSWFDVCGRVVFTYISTWILMIVNNYGFRNVLLSRLGRPVSVDIFLDLFSIRRQRFFVILCTLFVHF